MSEPFWNLTNGRRPSEPVPGLFADVCKSIGHHVYDDVYGSRECARCGHPTERLIGPHKVSVCYVGNISWVEWHHHRLLYFWWPR